MAKMVVSLEKMGDSLETVPTVYVTGEKAGFVLDMNSFC
jgi:hypothetical protein